MPLIGLGRLGNSAQTPIQSSLLIGLGGTGKQVLLQLRQKFFERIGKTGFPTMAYLWIDTDMQNIGLDGRRLDYVQEQILFGADEKIDCQVHEQEFVNYFTQINAFRYIWKWLDPRLRTYGSIVDGARALRPLGRLAFFHKFNDIREMINNKATEIANVKNVDRMQTEYGQVIANPKRVYIISSLAGGTGSGMFLDCAFLVKHILGDANITGFFLLPSAFSANMTDAIFANAYAALKELEFYSLRKDFLTMNDAKVATEEYSYHDFDFEWQPGIPGKPMLGPPFKTCYLIDNKTERGAAFGPDNKIEICDMIAENIFLDFAAQHDFATIKRSIRSNLEEKLINYFNFEYKDAKENVLSNDTFSLRFSTFGLSKIFIPIHRIKNACIYRLASDLVHFWLRENRPPADLRTIVIRDIIPSLQVATLDALTNKLGVADSTGAKIEDLIGRWIEEEKTKILAEVAVKKQGIMGRMNTSLDDFINKNYKLTGRSQDWGDYVRRIMVHNKEEVWERLKQNLLQNVNRWLDHYDMRFEYAISVLADIHKEITDIRIRCLKMLSDKNEKGTLIGGLEKKRVAVETALNRKLKIIGEVEAEWQSGPLNKSLRRSTLRTLIRQAMALEKEFLNVKRQMLILETAAAVYEDVLNFIGLESRVELKDGKVKIDRSGLIKQIRILQDVLSLELLPSLDEKFESYNRVIPELLNENLYEENMFRQYYKIDGKDVETNDRLNLDLLQGEEDRIFQEMETSVFGLALRFQEEGVPNVEDKMVRYCQKRFKDIIVHEEALIKFYEKYNKSQDFDVHFQRIVNHGSVWLRRGTHFMGVGGGQGSFESNIEKLQSIGIFNGTNAKYSDFRNRILNSGVGVTAARSWPVIEGHEVIINTEWGGLPIMFICDLDRYKNEAYIPLAARRALHIDKNNDKYVDILIRDPRDLNLYLEAHQTLLLGSILRVVEMIEENGEFHFVVVDTSIPGVDNRVPLGNEHIAIERLKSDAALRTQFIHKIKTIEMELTPNKLLEYYALTTYYLTKIYPLTYKSAGAAPISIQSLEYKVLNNKILDLQTMLHQRGYTDDQIRTSVSALAGNMDSFSMVLGASDRRVLVF